MTPLIIPLIPTSTPLLLAGVFPPAVSPEQQPTHGAQAGEDGVANNTASPCAEERVPVLVRFLVPRAPSRRML